jgi:hypothetical protein
LRKNAVQGERTSTKRMCIRTLQSCSKRVCELGSADSRVRWHAGMQG